MKWEKLGLVYNPKGRVPWMKTHASVPTAIILDDRIRVFLAFRDAENVGRIGWVDCSTDGQFKIIGESEHPCLDVGRPGAFDDNGVTPMAVLPWGEKLRCYYGGWQLTPQVRYLLFTGAAVSTDNGVTFTRESEVPVFERSSKELTVRSGAFVLQHEGIWKAWYAAGSEMIEVGQKAVPTYHLAYMESEDGLRWPSKGIVSIIPEAPDEFGFGRPFVEIKNGIYHIWYSVRTKSRGYFIGYATSDDGIRWKRQDAIGGLYPSKTGWDSEMTGFASIVETAAGRFMFYNGNGYGLTGVGVARLARESNGGS